LWQTKVKDISFGKVSATDTDFKYPEGTDVVDAIKGVHYKTDANGEPIESTIEPLYGLDPSQVKLPEPPKRKINIVFIVAGILLIVTAIYLHFKKRKK
jgi:LPXTG-motif cell wall-anchored protein